MADIEFETEELTEAIEILFDTIANERTHPNYKRVTDLANDYFAYKTGIGLDDKLQQVVRREDDDMFEQRVLITKHIIPAVVSNLTSVERKIPRSNGMTRVIAYEKDDSGKKAKALEDILGKYWGNKSFDDWMAIRFFELNDIDPNTFVVSEWKPYDGTKENIQPYPYEISASQAVMFDYDNNILTYVIDKKDIEIEDESKEKKEGFKFTMYLKNQTIIATQIINDSIKADLSDEGVIEKIGDSYYVRFKESVYLIEFPQPHDAGIVPCERIGYKRDDATNGNTYVSPYHDAVPYLEKTIKSNSEMDLTQACHAFPQKIIAAPKCKNEKCLGGYITDEDGNKTVCPDCEGAGLRLHKSAQDVILVKLATDKDEQIDIDNIIKYVVTDTALLEFMDKYIDKLTHKCKEAMFNSDIFTKSEISMTATEKRIDLDNVYDTLYPFAVKFSQEWKFTVELIANLADMEKGLVAAHSFSKDFKFKSKDDYIDDRESALKAGCPDPILRTIDNEIMQIDHSDNPFEFKKYLVKQEFYPFTGKSKEEIIDIKSRHNIPKFIIVLDDNYGWIFDELEREVPGFYDMKKDQQWKAIEKKVNEIIEKLEEPETQAIELK